MNLKKSGKFWKKIFATKTTQILHSLMIIAIGLSYNVKGDAKVRLMYLDKDMKMREAIYS